ncbi:MAG: type II toxin-antitoxin system HicB family antitoxin [Thermodesulfobacteriota bacterium]|nr:type II toxin-antitoxin system HicB family antitoxin [Desulfovibrio sp.]
MLAYRIELVRDDNGTFLATCPDLPEVTTFGEDEREALIHVEDAIEEALAARMAKRRDVPPGCAATASPHVHLRLQTEIKVGLYCSMRDAGLRKADLARLLSVHAPQVDRLFDLRHASRLDQMEAAFRAMGKRLAVGVEPEPRP